MVNIGWFSFLKKLVSESFTIGNVCILSEILGLGSGAVWTIGPLRGKRVEFVVVVSPHAFLGFYNRWFVGGYD